MKAADPPHTAGTAVKSGRYFLASRQTVFLPPDRRWLGSSLGSLLSEGEGWIRDVDDLARW
jgi:hypothetical protein